MKNNKKGLAIVVVVFFAFAVGIFMAALLKASSNVYFLTKRTIHEMQVDYLLRSGVQMAKLYVNLFPIEMYNYYKDMYSKENQMKQKAEDYQFCPLDGLCGTECFNPPDTKNPKYDLFSKEKGIGFTPYNYEFGVTKVLYVNSQGNREKGVAARGESDTYRVVVEASVNNDDQGKKKKIYFSKETTEEFIISRY